MARDAREDVAYAADEARHGEAEPKQLDRIASNENEIEIGEVNLRSRHQLQRGLKSRHIQFLALGGA